ncbi:hypothetical protein [Lysinibacillus pakistanensis]|uniref:Uncharacterized protein n=1 Tax=Lysinibacillus pakistanensis TaxID=759811 RepID=A0AAX3X4I9_9BACI|nr:hypothetical protein [Lysinibacillus pakistanensis]MDM5233490.1 hypothetical protein [Lysinibacillus pakistanensis]WHY48962.1 hypothetical protein QNH22_12285 [Lysinibacillus pakistanensis]WHY53973.1 hypothetical protein QNH24_12265 [Lysinibacillus pakistanensis]
MFLHLPDNILIKQKSKMKCTYEEYLLAVGILTSGLLGLNTAEASEVEKDMIEVDSLIENLKTKHPDWTIKQVTLDEAAKS